MPGRPFFILSTWSTGQEHFNVMTYSSAERPRRLSRTSIRVKCESLTVTDVPSLRPSLRPGRLVVEPETTSDASLREEVWPVNKQADWVLSISSDEANARARRLRGPLSRPSSSSSSSSCPRSQRPQRRRWTKDRKRFYWSNRWRGSRLRPGCRRFLRRGVLFPPLVMPLSSTAARLSPVYRQS